MFGLWGAKLGRKTPATGRRHRPLVPPLPRGHAPTRRGRRHHRLVMLAWRRPALRAVWTPVDCTVIPTDKSARTVADAVAAEFAGTGGRPMTIAVLTAGRRTTRPRSRRTPTQVDDLPGVRPRHSGPAEPRPGSSTSPPRASPTAPPPSSWSNTRAVDQEARSRPGGRPGRRLRRPAEAIADRLPLAAGLLVALTLIVLWLMTGSVVLPIKAVLMNALTVGGRARASSCSSTRTAG